MRPAIADRPPAPPSPPNRPQLHRPQRSPPGDDLTSRIDRASETPACQRPRREGRSNSRAAGRGGSQGIDPMDIIAVTRANLVSLVVGESVKTD
eukprot:2126837-Karenia_brevis.AAC.1